MNVASFQRLYVNGGQGIEHPATPEIVDRAVSSMNDHAAGQDPFKVRDRFGDGTVVVISPKRRA